MIRRGRGRVIPRGLSGSLGGRWGNRREESKIVGLIEPVAPNPKHSQLTRAFGGGHLCITNRIHSSVAKCKVHNRDTGTEVSRINGSLDCIVREFVSLGICIWRSGGTG